MPVLDFAWTCPVREGWYFLSLKAHLTMNEGSLGCVHSVYIVPSSRKQHARMIMFFAAGWYLKQTRSSNCLDLTS